MSEMQRWFPMSVTRTPRSFFDPSMELLNSDDFSAMDRRMRAMQREMDRMFSDFQRLAPCMGDVPTSPFEMRNAEDALALNPIVADKDGKRKMQMNFDVRAFKPDEITVKTKDGKFLEVHAKHEEASETGKIMRQYHRVFSIPQGVETQDMSSVLSPEGVLSVTAPIKEPQAAIEPAKEQPIAIKHE